MADFIWKSEWAKIIKTQEETLLYDSFDEETALELGLILIDLVKERDYEKLPALRIMIDNTTVFAYKFPGSSEENDWWMNRKLAVARHAGMSSLRAYVEGNLGNMDKFWEAREMNFAPCGGCVPIKMKDGSKTFAHVLCSNLKHFDDHQLLMDGIAKQLGVEIPKVTE